MKHFSVFAPLALAACAAVPPAAVPPPPAAPAGVSFQSATIGIGGTAMLNGVRLRPLAVIEDSRCPANVQCVWAGRLRLLVELGSPGVPALRRELTLGEAVRLDQGQLALAAARPEPQAGARLDPLAYGFTFTLQNPPSS